MKYKFLRKYILTKYFDKERVYRALLLYKYKTLKDGKIDKAAYLSPPCEDRGKAVEELWNNLSKFLEKSETGQFGYKKKIKISKVESVKKEVLKRYPNWNYFYK